MPTRPSLDCVYMYVEDCMEQWKWGALDVMRGALVLEFGAAYDRALYGSFPQQIQEGFVRYGWDGGGIGAGSFMGKGFQNSPRSGSCRKSFSGDTRVLMADGTVRPIKDVTVGDFVLATDPATGEEGPREVTHVWVHDDQLVDLKVDGGDLTTTEDHPFWNETDRQWQESQDLDPGDRLHTVTGGTLAVLGLDWNTRQQGAAYNLTVADIHTYYVMAGSTPVLVHNTNGCRTASKYEDITSPGARVPNRLTDVGPNEFGQNLEANGWTRIDKGPNIMYEKDGARYFLRGKADSYGGWTADFYKAGSKKADLKIRLGDD